MFHSREVDQDPATLQNKRLDHLSQLTGRVAYYSPVTLDRGYNIVAFIRGLLDFIAEGRLWRRTHAISLVPSVFTRENHPRRIQQVSHSNARC
jgi:hypothetical protein